MTLCARIYTPISLHLKNFNLTTSHSIPSPPEIHLPAPEINLPPPGLHLPLPKKRGSNGLYDTTRVYKFKNMDKTAQEHQRIVSQYYVDDLIYTCTYIKMNSIPLYETNGHIEDTTNTEKMSRVAVMYYLKRSSLNL